MAIPWEDAEAIARKHGLRQVILIGWDGRQVHVVTWGDDVHQGDQAAQGGNLLKRTLGWPDQLCESESAKVQVLLDRIAELESLVFG